jgi:hypothetical protein
MVNLFALLCLVVLAYLVILAVSTAQIAVAEEDGSRAFIPGYSRFFSMMGTNRRDYRQIAGMTETLFIFQSIYTALPRTDIAGTQPRLQCSGTMR